MIDLGNRFEFHAHTFFSDGVLGPAELIRYGVDMGFDVISLTDHVDFSNIEHTLKSQRKMIEEVTWDIEIIQGVELTHVPADKIEKIALMARKLGAELVVCHGETVMEPVEPGTNMAAVSCPYVDILAHPGNLTPQVAEKAAENGVFLELTARRGHNKTNGRVADVGRQAGAKFLVNSDAHAPEDLVSQRQAFDIALQAGLSREAAVMAVSMNTVELLEKIMSQ